MSFKNFLGDVFSGNFSNALKRLEDWYVGAPQWLKDFIHKSESQEAAILQGLIHMALPDLQKNGFTTAGFVATAKDILAQLVAQNISTFTIQDIFANLNAAASPLATAASIDPVQATE